MKALVYHGPRHVRVDEVADARIERPTDALVRVTATNICGSDLHMYEGRTDLPAGTILGHENLGEVVDVGAGVDKVTVGDLVCLPFNIGCGHCKNCEHGWSSYCLRANDQPGMAGAAYGYADMGPYAGGQAELLRVPWADFNCLRLPDDARDRQDDYAMLSDIFPTAWHALEMAGQRPGESVVIYGAGPVGLMAAMSAGLRGASLVLVVDRHRDRLRLAGQAGAIAVDDSQAPAVEQVLEHTGGLGADRGCECVGFQAHDPRGHEDNAATFNALAASVRFTGGIGNVGVFLPQDPGGATEPARHGKAPVDLGRFWLKGQHMGCGQAPVKRYDRHLRSLIHAGKAKPSWIVSHRLPLEQAPAAYKHFDAREAGWTKVVLRPGQPA